MRNLAGTILSARGTWDGAGVNFALFSEHATKVELCLFDSADADKESAADPADGAHRQGLARLPARRPARPALRLPRPRAVRAGQGASLQPQQGRCSTPTPRRSAATCAGPTSCSATRSATRRPTCRSTSATAPPFAPLARRDRSGLHLGRRPAAAHPWHKTLIYELHVKGFTKLHPDVPEKLRGTYAGLASEPAIKHLTDLGVTAVELLPVHHHVDDRHLVEKGLTQLLGLQHAGLLRPELALLPARASPQDAVQQFKMMVRALHAAGHRGDPRRGLQPHRRGQPAGPDALDARHRQRRLLPAVARRPALLHGLHRLRQHAEHDAPARPAAHHGQPALLGHSRCTSTASASTWPARWPASCSRSTGWARSSTSSTRTRSCRRSS